VIPVELLIILLAVLVVAGLGAAFVSTRRRRGVELEPPPPRVLEQDVPADVLVEEPPVLVEEPPVVIDEPPVVVEQPPVKPRFRDRLGKARGVFAGFLGRTTIDEATWGELEDALILADVGIGLTAEVLDSLRLQVKEQAVTDAAELRGLLAAELKGRLAADRALRLDDDVTNVWLFVGVNGVGKTTTIGKVARRMADAGTATVLAAGDTFRAAAAEQLGTWAERAGAPLVRGAEGSDPSAVIFDAVESGHAKGIPLVLADTAGRLHTKSNLMEELSKVRRVAEKGAGVVTEVLLVLDATTGQNGIVQAREFTAAVDVTGVVLTKLDGSAKGGIVLAIQHEFGIPVKLVGLGESAADLVDFDPEEFVEALLA
jgi:fused signal recognition particle receptor